MATKNTTSRKRSSTSKAATAKKTIGKIEDLGKRVVKSSLAQKDPYVDVPTRSISNTQFNKRRRILEMGDNSQQRNLFNLGQAKKFMQTVLLSKGCRDLIKADKTLSLRGMFYKSLHTIAGTNEKTFASQLSNRNL